MGVNLNSDMDDDANLAAMSEINVTPFVDVMLVLLIVFMVAAPLMIAGVPVNLPQQRPRVRTHRKNQSLSPSRRTAPFTFETLKSNAASFLRTYRNFAQRRETLLLMSGLTKRLPMAT